MDNQLTPFEASDEPGFRTPTTFAEVEQAYGDHRLEELARAWVSKNNTTHEENCGLFLPIDFGDFALRFHIYYRGWRFVVEVMKKQPPLGYEIGKHFQSVLTFTVSNVHGRFSVAIHEALLEALRIMRRLENDRLIDEAMKDGP